MDKKTSNGLGISDVLLVVFIVLKLLGIINWGWGWVLAPLWIPLLILLVIACFTWILK